MNSLIHRNYLMPGSEVHIDIYDNHLEVISPGSMFEGGVLPDNVLTQSIPSLRRNPILADLFQRMHYMERRGSGLRKICQATMSESNFEDRFMPSFEERGGFFFVTLWDMNYDTVQHSTPLVEENKSQFRGDTDIVTPQSPPQSPL